MYHPLPHPDLITDHWYHFITDDLFHFKGIVIDGQVLDIKGVPQLARWVWVHPLTGEGGYLS